MPLWGSKDNAANSDIAAVIQYNKATTTANQSLLYGNTLSGTFISGMAVGQFGVDTNEITAAPAGHGYHAGWVLRKEGTGLRAGRVTYETLVAMGSMTLDGSDDTYMPDYRLVINTQPVSNTAATMKNLNISVSAASIPAGATLGYKWQKSYAGVQAWTDVPNSSFFLNNTSPTFTANNFVANGNVFRVIVTATGANTVTSSNATITYIV